MKTSSASSPSSKTLTHFSPYSSEKKIKTRLKILTSGQPGHLMIERSWFRFLLQSDYNIFVAFNVCDCRKCIEWRKQSCLELIRLGQAIITEHYLVQLQIYYKPFTILCNPIADKLELNIITWRHYRNCLIFFLFQLTSRQPWQSYYWKWEPNIPPSQAAQKPCQQ